MARIPDPSQRLAAILFADMVGFSTLRQRVALQFQGEMLALAREGLERHHGRLVKTMGDGFLAEFAAANDAVGFAIQLQNRIAERNRAVAAVERFRLRVGVHFGDVVARGEEIDGTTVNIAARAEPLAAPGGVCMTEQVWEQVQEQLPRRAERLGKLRVKGLGRGLCFHHLYAADAGWVTRLRHRARLFFNWPGRLPASIVAAGLIVGAAVWSRPLASSLWDFISPPTTEQRVARAQKDLEQFDLKGHIPAAIDELQTAKDKASANSDPSDANAWLGLAYWRSYKESLSVEERTQAAKASAAATNMNSPLAYFVQGLVAKDEGGPRLQDAVGLLRRANELYKEENCEALVDLADSYRLVQDFTKAGWYFERAGKATPKGWSDYNRMGAYYEDSGNFEAARTNFQEALRLTDDRSPLAWRNLGGAWQLLGQTKEARDAFDESLKRRKTPEAYSGKGSLLLDAEQWPAAADNFLLAANCCPSNYLYWGNAGLALLHLTNRQTDARQYLTQAVEQAEMELRDKPDCLVLVQVGQYEAILGQKSKADQDLRQALEQCANSARVLYAAIAAYVGLHDRSRADPLIRRAMDRSPGDASVLQDAIEAYRELGETEKAQELKKQLDTRPNPRHKPN